MFRQRLFIAAIVFVLLAHAVAAPTPLVGFADGRGVYVLKDGEVYFWFSYPLWGPRWAWTGYRPSTVNEGGRDVFVLRATLRGSGARLTLRAEARQVGPKTLSLSYRLSSDKDARLTLAAVALGPRAALRGGKTLVRTTDGKTATRQIPYGRQPLGTAVASMTLTDREGAATTLRFGPAATIQADGDARIVLAAGRIASAAPRALKIEIELPDAITFYSSPGAVPESDAQRDWFAWKPASKLPATSELAMEDWLEKPAGKHGRITRKGDKLIYDGKPIKLWGLNLCYRSCCPEKELADRRARFYPRFGINAVRLHKYADGPGWAGILSRESFVEFDPEALDRMDYQVAKLRERGIYVVLSPTFGTVALGPKERQRLPFAREFGAPRGNGYVRAPHGALYFSRELQDLQIRQMLNLLAHRNPHTGLTYAEDPAIAAIEIVNEHSALFYSAMSALQRCPTLRKNAARWFSDWLEDRYGDEAGLIKAWGKGTLNSFSRERFTGESLAAGTIVPAGNPWFFDPAQLEGSQAFRRQRLLDTMRFLYELQNDFYARYLQAVRKAGYRGEVIASNWQAGRAYSHFLNLHSDYLVGLIDRHNYFGGRTEGWVNNATMLADPGSGTLSAGLQQVADRPFMLSEWIHVFPNEWGVEGPAIIGAYGLGLQGWDASFMFQNGDEGTFSDRVGRHPWDVTVPQILGSFPAIARLVHRGDVAESKTIAPLRVHVPSLFQGRLGFDDSVEQAYDIKTFTTDKVPSRALAVARTVVEFTDAFRPTPAFDLSRYERNGALVSSTGQLAWWPGRGRLDGHFTINTPATKAVVGFAEGRTCDLGNVTIRPLSRFAAIYVTAREKDKDLRDSTALLVVAIARARNTGMKILFDRFLLSRGEPPVLMEPVAAEITVRRPGAFRVVALDHDGCPTDTRLPVNANKFTIDGAKYKTPYYEILFE